MNLFYLHPLINLSARLEQEKQDGDSRTRFNNYNFGK